MATSPSSSVSQDKLDKCSQCDDQLAQMLLDCSKHSICRICVQSRANSTPDALLECSLCDLKNSKDSELHVFVDNSTLWNEISTHVKKADGIDLDSCRVDIGELVSSVAGNRNIHGVFVYGSRPPKTDTVWNMPNVQVKRGIASTQLTADITEMACSSPTKAQSTILVITGRNGIHTANTCADKVATSECCSMEVCSWKDRIRKRTHPNVKALYLDDHVFKPKISVKTIGKQQFKQLFKKAMEHGFVKTRIGKVLLMGSAGSGKTCTINLIVGKPPPEKRVSTPLATRPITVRRVDTNSSTVWTTISSSQRKQKLIDAIKVQQQSAQKSQMQDKLKCSPVSKSGKARSASPRPTTPKQKVHREQRKHSPGKTFSYASASTYSQSGATNQLVDELASLIDSSQIQQEYCEEDLIHFTDSGGQPQFHEMLPNFLYQTNVFIFVFKLSESLSDFTTVEFYDESGDRLCSPYLSKKTNLQVFQHCVRTMLSYKKKNGKAPRIILIGTHRDKESESKESREDKEEKLASILLPTFQEEVVYSSFQGSQRKLIHPINAVRPEEIDQKITMKVRDLITSEGVDAVDIPIQWNALEIALQQLSETLGRTVLSKEECLQEASKLHFNRESFTAALDYFHDLNILFYFSESLPSVVFVDPQVVLDKATELVKVSHQLKLGSGLESAISQKRGCLRFQEHSLLTHRFLSHSEFRKHYITGIFTPQDLSKLFQDLLLFASLSSTEYFMPALLDTIDKTVEFGVEESAKACSSLICIFPHGGPQLGMFCSTVVSLLSPTNERPWMLKYTDSHQITPKCLYRNCVEFTVPDFPGSVTFIDSFQYFEVQVHIPDRIPTTLVKKMCSTVRSEIESALVKVANVLGYKAQPLQFGFLCPCTNTNRHAATVRESDQLIICSLDTNFYEEIKENQRVWLCLSAQGDFSTRNLCRELKTMTDPMSFGTQLGVDQARLEIIKRNNAQDIDGQKLHLFEYISQNHKALGITWETVTEALVLVDKMDLAQRLREKYLKLGHCAVTQSAQQ